MSIKSSSSKRSSISGSASVYYRYWGSSTTTTGFSFLELSIIFFKSAIVFSCIYMFISSSIFYNSSTWFLISSSRKSLFSFDRIFLGIESLILLALFIFSINYKPINSFLIPFLSDEVLSVYIYRAADLISSGTFVLSPIFLH